MITHQKRILNISKNIKKILIPKNLLQAILLLQQKQIIITKRSIGSLKLSQAQIKSLDQRQQEQKKTINIFTNDSILIFAYKLLTKIYYAYWFSSIITPLSLRMRFPLKN